MKKNIKFKLILFIILSVIIVCLLLFFNKNNNNKPNDNIDNPSEIPNEVEDTPDEVGTSYLNDIKYTVKVDKEVEDVMKTAHKIKIETNIECPKCGKPMIVRTGKNVRKR